MSQNHAQGHAGRATLAHHFDTPAQQYDSAKFAMWLFLVTEVLLFGGLFCAYAVYRANHPEVFLFAHTLLDKTLGAINTCVLLFSSFTMAWSVRAAMLGQRRLLIGLLAVTLLCGFGFLGIKGIEYEHKWKHGLLWGERFDYSQLHYPEHGTPGPNEVADGLDQSALRLDAHGYPPQAIPRNVHIFFGIYFVMTGLHGVHVIAGMIVIGWLLRRTLRGEFADGYHTPVDLGGLYWHLVDLVWIYLFPLLYLIH